MYMDHEWVKEQDMGRSQSHIEGMWMAEEVILNYGWIIEMGGSYSDDMFRADNDGLYGERHLERPGRYRGNDLGDNMNNMNMFT